MADIKKTANKVRAKLKGKSYLLLVKIKSIFEILRKNLSRTTMNKTT